MQFIKQRKKLLIIIAIIIVVIAIPLTIILLQRQQDIRQHAASATTLSFSPTSTSTNPILTNVNTSVTLDMMLNPGANAVSVVRYEITYDPTKVAIDATNPFTLNTTSFPTTLEGPIYTTGKISGTVSIGSDYSKAIVATTKVATVRFKALTTTNGTPAQISYTTNAQALSVSATDQASENVLSSTTPAFITILQPLANCGFSPTSSDIMMIVDISGSTTDNRVSQINAMNTFVDEVASMNNQYKIGLISYASVAKLNYSLQNGNDYAAVKNAISTMPFIDNASAGEDDAITLASQQFQTFGRAGIRKSIILLTDRWDSYAQTAANTDYAANKTAYYILAYDISNSTIRSMLQKQAANTGGTYHEFSHSTTTTTTETDILTSMASDVSCPTVTPALTPTNTPIPTPTPTAKPTPTNTPVPPTPTPTKVPSPTPTRVPTATPTPVPTNTPVPTATPIPQATKFDFTIYLHGLGHSGDSVNPSAFSLSNQNPVRQQRNLIVEVLTTGTSRQLVLTKTFATGLTYNAANGYFKGTVDMGTTLASGVYNINVHSDQYLYNSIAGIQVNAGQTNTFAPLTFITGDVNNDDKLDILDYDIITGCYSDFAPPVDCPATIVQNTSFTLAQAADLTDNGKVDQYDYNLFLREYSVQTSARILPQ